MSRRVHPFFITPLTSAAGRQIIPIDVSQSGRIYVNGHRLIELATHVRPLRRPAINRRVAVVVDTSANVTVRSRRRRRARHRKLAHHTCAAVPGDETHELPFVWSSHAKRHFVRRRRRHVSGCVNLIAYDKNLRRFVARRFVLDVARRLATQLAAPVANALDGFPSVTPPTYCFVVGRIGERPPFAVEAIVPTAADADQEWNADDQCDADPLPRVLLVAGFVGFCRRSDEVVHCVTARANMTTCLDEAVDSSLDGLTSRLRRVACLVMMIVNSSTCYSHAQCSIVNYNYNYN
jgi:hypothetical protein